MSIVLGILVTLGGLWIAERSMGPGNWGLLFAGAMVIILGAGLIVWGFQ